MGWGSLFVTEPCVTNSSLLHPVAAPVKYGFPQFPQAAKERKKKQKRKKMAATTIDPIPPFTPEGEYYKGS
jgi:hypothetical protein